MPDAAAAASHHVNVLIVGAGLSGIGAACHLTMQFPNKSFAILEARAASGGTWDLFRYPGVRSDSDMFTLGFPFRPWRGAQSIADGASILRYIRDTAREYGVDEHIRYSRCVTAADWSTQDARWTVQVRRTDTGETEQLTCDFLWGNTGYYDYDEGYAPHFDGIEHFAGEVVHPQHWPEGLDWAGKRVVVIGSGATAVTLVPELAKTAAHVTMLQRSPSYVVTLPGKDSLADAVRKRLPERIAFPIVRWKNVLRTSAFYQLSRRRPELAKKFIRSMVKRQLPDGYDVDTHFAPTYNPWDQRVCLVPDGDLFRAIRHGSASVVTDKIEAFTERGIRLASGAELDADIVITATGLNMRLFGDIALSIDGSLLKLSDTIGYKGVLLSGVPNLAITIGYTNASWTLKCDLVASYVCRLLNHMDAHGYRVATPRGPDPNIPTRPFIDLESGYVTRSQHLLPRQGSRKPWQLHQNYPRDVLLLRRGPVDDEMAFSRS